MLKIIRKNRIPLIIFSGLYILLAIFYREFCVIYGYSFSPFLVFGFFLIVVSFIVFINLDHKKIDQNFLQFKFFSENLCCLIFIILMTISILIPSKNSTDSIILWNEVSILNYFRAITFILGLSFIPGSCIYRIIFKNDILQLRFNIHPLLIKITLYPLISFSFIGIFILILDQINLNGELIGFFLFIFIFCIFLFEIYLEKRRKDSINMKIVNIKMSQYTFIIILLAFGILTISIGFQKAWEYLISGDPWDAIKYAKYVGDIAADPLSIELYPNLWGYISFGLSVLGGLPFININTLLAPFSYLFITSAYLLMKALLNQFKTKYAVLSTILISIFSGILMNPVLSTLIFASEFYYIYKSFSFFLFFVSIAIFIILLKNSIKEDYWHNRKKNELYMLIGLIGFFLVVSFMTYIYPLFIGIIFLFLYGVFSLKGRIFLNMKYFCYLLLFIFSFLLIFDFIMDFYLSYILISRFLGFFNYEFLITFSNFIPVPILIYSLYIIFLSMIFIITFILSKKIIIIKIRKRIKNLTFKKIFRLFLIVFIFFSTIEFSLILFEAIFLNLNFSNNSFFFLYLDKIFLNLGFIGVFGISVSYYCWKRDKFLFLTLTSWIITSFMLAFIKQFIEFFEVFPLSPESISESDVFVMDYWFDRLWFYSIPALCIFASIGLFKLFKKIREFKIINKIRISPIISKNIIALTLFFSSFSGIVITGLVYGNPNFRYTDTQIETLNWISENIPLYSGVVVGDNFFMGVGTDSITFVRQYFFYDIFKADFNQTKCIERIGFLKNETIQYAVISQFFISYFLNKSDFVNNILVPDFYNVTLYNNGDLTVYYAPFFD